MELAEAIIWVDPNSSEATLLDKRKGKKFTAGTSKRSKKKVKETSLAFLPSTGVVAELGRGARVLLSIFGSLSFLPTSSVGR